MKWSLKWIALERVRYAVKVVYRPINAHQNMIWDSTCIRILHTTDVHSISTLTNHFITDSIKSVLHLRICLTNCLFQEGSLTEILCGSLVSLMRATFHLYFSSYRQCNWLIVNEHKLWSSSLCSFHNPVATWPESNQIYLSALCSRTPSVCNHLLEWERMYSRVLYGLILHYQVSCTKCSRRDLWVEC
jgi:hypothetical protein